MRDTPWESAQALDALDQVVLAATEGLFDAYDLPVRGKRLTQGGWSVQDSNSASVVGFTGTDFSGSLVIGTSLEIIHRTAPGEAQSVYDWMGELANQLLGRIKNRLLKHGVVLQMALPVVIMGIELQTPVIEGRCVLDYRFDSAFGRVVIRMDLTPTWRLQPALDGPDSTAAEEGAMLLF